MKGKLFGSKAIGDLIKEKKSEIVCIIEAKPEDYILGVNEGEFVNYLYDKYYIEEIAFDLDNVKLSSYETDVRHDKFTRESYVFQVIVYHVPVSGNKGLLKYKPSRVFINYFPDVYLDHEEKNLCFDIEAIGIDKNTIKSKADNILDTIKKNSFHINNEVNIYNSALKDYISSIFNSRKKRIFKNKQMLESLEVPVIEEKNVAQSFIIPSPDIIKKIKIEEPKAVNNIYTSEPTISIEIYQHILNTIHDLGMAFEKYPSLYKDKD